jgi:hypothetical protein
MKVLSQYILAAVISFEFVIITLAFALVLFWPNLISPVSSLLGNDADFIKHAALLPSALAIWVFSESRKLLFPDEDKKRVLQQWEDYWKWRIHFNVGIFYVVLFAGSGLTFWALGIKVNTETGFVVLLTPIIGSLIVALSVYLARITLSEMLIGGK